MHKSRKSAVAAVVAAVASFLVPISSSAVQTQRVFETLRFESGSSIVSGVFGMKKDGQSVVAGSVEIRVGDQGFSSDGWGNLLGVGGYGTYDGGGWCVRLTEPLDAPADVIASYMVSWPPASSGSSTAESGERPAERERRSEILAAGAGSKTLSGWFSDLRDGEAVAPGSLRVSVAGFEFRDDGEGTLVGDGGTGKCGNGGWSLDLDAPLSFSASICVSYEVVRPLYNTFAMSETWTASAGAQCVSGRFTKKKDNQSVVAGSVNIRIGSLEFIDDGKGHLSGADSSGSYVDSGWAITLRYPLPETTKISVNYQVSGDELFAWTGPEVSSETVTGQNRIAETQTASAGNSFLSGRFTKKKDNQSVVAGSVNIRIGSLEFIDDGKGHLSGADSSGSYDDSGWAITLRYPLPETTKVSVVYSVAWGSTTTFSVTQADYAQCVSTDGKMEVTIETSPIAETLTARFGNQVFVGGFTKKKYYQSVVLGSVNIIIGSYGFTDDGAGGLFGEAGSGAYDGSGWTITLKYLLAYDAAVLVHYVVSHEIEYYSTASWNACSVDKRPFVGRVYRTTGAPFEGNRLVLRAKGFGAEPLSYEWRRDGVRVSEDEVLEIPELRPGDFGTYTLTVRNSHGEAVSEPFEVSTAASGVPVCWGASGHGRTEPPDGLSGVAQVASGMNFNLALGTNGLVTAWGYNGHGACDVPEGLSDVSSVAAGGWDSQGAGFAVKRDGSVVGWGRPHEIESYWSDYYVSDYGYDESGNWFDNGYWDSTLVENTNGWDTVSTMPEDLADVVKVAVGGEFAAALLADGTVEVWGAEIERWREVEFDDGWGAYTNWESYMVDAYSPPAWLDDVVDIYAGDNYLIALRADGTVAVWGADDWSSCNSFGLSDVCAIGGRTGSSNCHAIRADGSLVAITPSGVSVESGETYSAIAGGQHHVAALRADGGVSVRVAGRDAYGISRVPEVVSSGSAFAIAAGGYHMTALLPDADGDTVCDVEEIALGRDPLVWEDWTCASLHGIVSTDLAPTPGAVVRLFDASGKERAAARSDDDGYYRFDGIVPATYTLKVEANGAVNSWYDGVAAGSGNAPTPLPVAAGADMALDLALRPGQAPAFASPQFVVLDPDAPYATAVAAPEGAVAYLDFWPAAVGDDGTVDLGEVSASHAGKALHWFTLKLPSGSPIPVPAAVAGSEGRIQEPVVAVAGPTGALLVDSEPRGAEVFVDYADEAAGVTPLMLDDLVAGSHTVLLRKDGWLRPRPVVAQVVPTSATEVRVPLAAEGAGPEMTVLVDCPLPEQEIFLDYLPTGDFAPAVVSGMDPASHAGLGWYSASHTVLLRHPDVRPWAPRFVPEPVEDPETGEKSYSSALEIDGPQRYDDANGDGVRNDVDIAAGLSPFYSLAAALDAETLQWTTGGDARWTAMRSGAVPTGGFARSGAIGDSAESWVSTTVDGAGEVSFAWKVSCQNRADTLAFFVDGRRMAQVTGTSMADWARVSIRLDEVAAHELRWVYKKSPTTRDGEDCGWLDEVSWAPDSAANALALAVASRFGEPDPAVGDNWYSYGDVVTARPLPDGDTAVATDGSGTVLTVATCIGWRGTGSAPASGEGSDLSFRLEDDSTVEWLWDVRHSVRLAATGPGTLRFVGDVGGPLFADGSVVEVEAVPGDSAVGFAWGGDAAGEPDGRRRVSVVVDGPKRVTVAFAPLDYETALDLPGAEWTSGGDAPWRAQLAVSADGEAACASPSWTEPGDHESWIETSFARGGTLSWQWRLEPGSATAGLQVAVDGVESDSVFLFGDGWTGGSGWQRGEIELPDDGAAHVVRWIYWRSSLGTDDFAWLDTVALDAGESQASAVPPEVPLAWLAEYGLADDDSGESGAADASATAANGENTLWECYVLGLDPTAPSASFRALIDIVDGEPVVSWDPPRPERTPEQWYRIEGKSALDSAEEWEPANATHRFFRVRVDVPDAVPVAAPARR